jgi:TetR/AcrR family transcriptional regulator, lmrAB and yxaGH operons repressor
MPGDTRARILEATTELMRRNGYAGTSMNDVGAAAGARMSSLYFHFPGGKEQIAAEAAAASARRFLDHLHAELPNAITPGDVVRSYFAPSIRALETSDFQAGCPVGTPANDAPASATTLKTACDQALAAFADAVARQLQRLGRTPDRAHAESTLIVATNQGAILLARTAHDKAPIQAALDGLLHLIDNTG